MRWDLPGTPQTAEPTKAQRLFPGPWPPPFPRRTGRRRRVVFIHMQEPLMAALGGKRVSLS